MCEPTVKEFADYPDNPCRMEIADAIFTDNEAEVGGAIRWNLMEPIVSETNKNSEFEVSSDGTVKYGSLTFRNNKAVEYGPEIASVARELINFGESTIEGSTSVYLNYYNGTQSDR